MPQRCNRPSVVDRLSIPRTFPALVRRSGSALSRVQYSCYVSVMTARRHHFISQCYLNRFAVLRKAGKFQTRVFDRVTGKSFPTAIENIGLERDFNRIEVEGHPPDAFEAGIAAYESELAPALERTVSSCGFADDRDKNLIFNLIASLALRNPRWRESIRQFHEETAKTVLGVTLASKERWTQQQKKAVEEGSTPPDGDVTYEELKQFHEEGNYRIELDTGYHLQMEMKGVDAILPLLARRGWAFCRAPKDSGGFVTSDHPVSLIWAKGQNPGQFYSPGFGLPDTEIVFPLSPRIALLGAFEIADSVHEINEAMVAGVNACTINFATRQVYARDLNFHYQFPDGQPVKKASRLIDDSRFLRGQDTAADKPVVRRGKRASHTDPRHAQGPRKTPGQGA